jgi:hypothetical protein
LEELLKRLPSQGPLFPKISKEKTNRRSGDFWRRCRRLGFPPGCVLHSYRHGGLKPVAFCFENIKKAPFGAAMHYLRCGTD